MNSKERHELRYKRRRQMRLLKKYEFIKQYDDINNVSNIDSLLEAAKKSRCTVGWKESVQRYFKNLLSNLSKTKLDIDKGNQITRGFTEFDLNERGKIRHIKSIHFSERVIQRSLCDNVLVPVLSKSLIYDNGACLKNKGISFSSNRIYHHLKEYYRHNNFSNDGYILLIDFSKYFDNILHKCIYDKLFKIFNNDKILNLIKQCIDVFGNGVSLGIGSQISQIIALFYPNNIDHFIKDKLSIKYYGRYMDDSYIIHKDKKYLISLLHTLKKKFSELGIIVNEKKTQIIKLSKGFSFLKRRYYLTNTGKIVVKLNKKSITRMRRKLKKFYKFYIKGIMSYEDVLQSYISWKGYMTTKTSYMVIKNMNRLFDKLFNKEQKILI